MKRVIFILLVIFPSFMLTAQNTSVKWYTIEEAEKLIRDNPRPIFIDTYTDWCGWCKKLDSDVFSDPVIANILNEKYYAVKFDAESRKSVVFQGKTYKNDGTIGRTHQLAYALLKGKMSYPTVVFLNNKAEVITPLPGFRSAKEFEPILEFFSGTDWETKTYEDFTKTFTGKVVEVVVE